MEGVGKNQYGYSALAAVYLIHIIFLFIKDCSRGKSQILRLAAPIQLLCDFVENLEETRNDCATGTYNETENQIAHSDNLPPCPIPQTAKDKDKMSDTSDDTDDQPPTASPCEQNGETLNDNVISAQTIAIAASIVKCSPTQLIIFKLRIKQAIVDFFRHVT